MATLFIDTSNIKLPDETDVDVISSTLIILHFLIFLQWYVAITISSVTKIFQHCYSVFAFLAVPFKPGLSTILFSDLLLTFVHRGHVYNCSSAGLRRVLKADIGIFVFRLVEINIVCIRRDQKSLSKVFSSTSSSMD